ncbi:hypothetical protein D3C71_1196350 [compost metagenome]
MRCVLDCGLMQAQWHGRGQAAEAGIDQPILVLQTHPQEQVRTRGQLALCSRQQHPSAQRSRIEAQGLQQGQERAIEFEAVTAALRVQQLVLDAVQVDRYRVAQQAGQGLERQQGVVALLQQGQPGQGERGRGIQLQALQVAGDVDGHGRHHGQGAPL